MQTGDVTLVGVLDLDPDLDLAFAGADEIAVMDNGRIVHRSPTIQFRSNSSVARTARSLVTEMDDPRWDCQDVDCQP